MRFELNREGLLVLLANHYTALGALYSITRELYKWEIGGAYDKFPDFFRKVTFIDGTHMKL